MNHEAVCRTAPATPGLLTMKGKYKEPYTCPHCSDGLEAIESPLQLMSCKGYEDFRQGIDPELDQKERPGYLGKVI